MKWKLLALFAFFHFTNSVCAQNLYADTFNRSFGYICYKRGDYLRAATAFEYNANINQQDALMAAKCYRLAQQYHSSLRCLDTWRNSDSNSHVLKEISINEYLLGISNKIISRKDSLLLNDLYRFINDSIYQTLVSTPWKPWKTEASIPFHQYDMDTRNWWESVYQYKQKRKGWAMFYSIIPGGGKAYLGRWPDAFSNFALVGVNGALSGYAFNRNGPQSVWGYAFLGLATGYYLSGFVGNLRLLKEDHWVFLNKQKDEAHRLAYRYFLTW